MRDPKYQKVTVVKQDGTTIPEDEPVFVIRAQDILSPIIIRAYADLLEDTTGNIQEADRIRMFAEEMAKWPVKKIPD